MAKKRDIIVAAVIIAFFLVAFGFFALIMVGIVADDGGLDLGGLGGGNVGIIEVYGVLNEETGRPMSSVFGLVDDDMLPTQMAVSSRIAEVLSTVDRDRAGHEELLAALRSEMSQPVERDILVGDVLRGLFECEDRDDRFARVVRVWTGRITRHLRAGNLSEAQALLDRIMVDAPFPTERSAQVRDGLDKLGRPDILKFVLDSEGIGEPIPTQPREVYDVTGAGDNVIAVLAYGLAAGLDHVTAARLANVAGSIAVERFGVVTIGWDEIATRIAAKQGGVAKLVTPDVLKRLLRGARAAGRKIVLDGADMIIRDTPEHLQMAEAFLTDKRLLSGIASRQLEIGKWNLTPRDVVTQDSEALRAFFAGVVEVIETRLYSVQGKTAAAADGRRLWADPSLLSITITDTEQNIAAVGQYIDQLEILDRPQQSKILYLKHADASDIAAQLRDVLGLEPTTGGSAGGDSVTRSLRQGDDFTWRDLRIRRVRVEDNDFNDENDDSAEFVLRTSTSDSEPTIEEFYTERISDANGEYEINVLDIDPSGNDDGEGRARIEVTYFEAVAP